MGDHPLIVTAGLDAVSFSHFDEMRRRHFPSERNFIPAHLTLFHHLPATEQRAIRLALQEEASRSGEITVSVANIFFMGFGCAYRIESGALSALRKRLADQFSPWLTKQDSQPFRPHITIQNKAPAREAKELFGELQASFAPFEARVEALLLWQYLGGPWEAAGSYPLYGSSDR